MRGNDVCLDCAQVDGLCDTCAFLFVRLRWRKVHRAEPSRHLWWAAQQWGGRHVLAQVKRQLWAYDAMVVKPRRAK